MNDEKFLKIKKIYQAEIGGNTTRQYLWHLKKYNSWLEGTKKGNIEGVDDPMRSVVEYLFDMSQEPTNWSHSLVNVSFYALKRYWEKIKGIPIERRFFTNTGLISNYSPRILTREEVINLWTEANLNLNKLELIMIITGWEAALRTGELTSLKGKSLIGDRTLEVRVLKTKRAIKRVPISESLASELEKLNIDHNKHFFVRKLEGQNRKRRYTPLEWSCWFRRWNKTVLGGDGVRWHDYARHTRLTHYAEDTKNFLAVLQLSGHQNPRVCRQYFERAKIDVPELGAIQEQKWDWNK